MAASFIDKARIFCRAGKGGNGAVAFHREKYVSAGGPDGGDGGNGGNIVLVVDDNMSTLMDFRYKRKYVADNGVDGQGARKFGKQGKDLTIRVPRGTVVRDAEIERDHQGYVRLRAVHVSAAAARAAGATRISQRRRVRRPVLPNRAFRARSTMSCSS